MISAGDAQTLRLSSQPTRPAFGCTPLSWTADGSHNGDACHLAGERILFVEDKMDARRFFAESVLRPFGYDVLTAANGNEALALARDLLPDLIISDYMLPGLNGLQILEALHSEGIHLPFILITGAGSEALAVEALRLGVRDYLIKPFDMDNLLNAVQRVLREHWTRQITDQIPAQLFEANLQLEQRLHDLDALVQIGKQVTALLDLDSVLYQVVEAAMTIAQAEEGSLLLVDEPTGELYLYASIDQKGRSRESSACAWTTVSPGRSSGAASRW